MEIMHFNSNRLKIHFSFIIILTTMPLFCTSALLFCYLVSQEKIFILTTKKFIHSRSSFLLSAKIEKCEKRNPRFSVLFVNRKQNSVNVEIKTIQLHLKVINSSIHLCYNQCRETINVESVWKLLTVENDTMIHSEKEFYLCSKLCWT